MNKEGGSITVSINGKQYVFDHCYTVIEACKMVGIDIPHFCYHKKLKIAGNCRMCLVDIEGPAHKPVPSCTVTISDSMSIRTDTKMIREARNGVIEFFLLNHPLDCPICDQGGECDLQDQAITYGNNTGRFYESKRVVSKKYFSPVIDLHMTRCIHCTRCIRFMEDIAGEQDLAMIGRGFDAEISTMLRKCITSELSGNIIDLCPVGALTSRPYAGKARAWELKKTDSIDIMDGVGSSIRVDSRNEEVMRILPRYNDEINEEWITDKIRFSYDGLKIQRLDRPYVKVKLEQHKANRVYNNNSNKFKEVDWDVLYKSVVSILKSTDPSNIAFLIGNLVDCETIYALKNLASVLNIEKIESRCDRSFIPTSNRWFYCFNTGIENIGKADLFVLVFTNPKIDAPIINSKIYQNVALNGTSVFVIGDRIDLNYSFEYIGDTLYDISSILDTSSEIYKALKKAKRPVFIIGDITFSFGEQDILENVLHMIVKKFNLMRDDWHGFNMLHRVANKVGAFDLKFFPNDRKYDVFSDTSIKVLYLVGCDDLEESFLEGKFIIYQGHHGCEVAHYADILIPVPAFTEKTATYINTEGRAQIAKKAVSKLYMSRDDTNVINSIIKMVDHAFDIEKSEREFKKLDIFSNIGKRVKNIFNQSGLCIDKDKFIMSKARIVFNMAGKRSFYITNSIARFSNAMAAMVECVNENDQQNRTEEERCL